MTKYPKFCGWGRANSPNSPIWLNFWPKNLTPPPSCSTANGRFFSPPFLLVTKIWDLLVTKFGALPLAVLASNTSYGFILSRVFEIACDGRTQGVVHSNTHNDTHSNTHVSTNKTHINAHATAHVDTHVNAHVNTNVIAHPFEILGDRFARWAVGIWADFAHHGANLELCV